MSKSNTFRRLSRHGKRSRRFGDGYRPDYRGFKTIGRQARCGRHFFRREEDDADTKKLTQHHITTIHYQIKIYA